MVRPSPFAPPGLRCPDPPNRGRAASSEEPRRGERCRYVCGRCTTLVKPPHPRVLLLVLIIAALPCGSVGCICVDAMATIEVAGTLESSAGKPVSGASVEVGFDEPGLPPNPLLAATTNPAGAFTADLAYDMYGGCAPWPLALLLPGLPPAPPHFRALRLTISQPDAETTISIPVTQAMVVRTESGAKVELGTVIFDGPAEGA